jgi:hypothetical protein
LFILFESQSWLEIYLIVMFIIMIPPCNLLTKITYFLSYFFNYNWKFLLNLIPKYLLMSIWLLNINSNKVEDFYRKEIEVDGDPAILESKKHKIK